MNVIVLTQQTETKDSNPTSCVEGVFAKPETAIEEGKKLFEQLKSQELDNAGDSEDVELTEFPDFINMNIGMTATATIYNYCYDTYIELTLTVMEVE